MEDIKTLHEDMQKTFAAFKEQNEKAEVERKTHGDALAETKAALDKLNARLDESEVKMQALVAPDKQVDDKGADEAKAAAFVKYLRHGDQRMSADELKLLATDQNDEGGYLVQPNYADQIVQKVIEVSPVRSVANVVTISQGNDLKVPVEGSTDFASGWVGERGTRSETDSATVDLVTINAYEMYAKPLATQNMLDDAAYDVEGWLAMRVATEFARREGAAFISGDMVLKPEGLLTNGDVGETNSGSNTALTADGLITLFYTLKAPYSANATWMMERASIAAVRKLKDDNDDYLWQPGLQAGQPATLLGRPVVTAEDMPTIAQNAYPVLVCDFRAGYWIVDKQGIRTLRDPFSSKPSVEFHTTMRVGGAVVLPEAIKKQKVSA